MTLFCAGPLPNGRLLGIEAFSGKAGTLFEIGGGTLFICGIISTLSGVAAGAELGANDG